MMKRLAGLCLLVDITAYGPQVHPLHRYVPGVPVATLAGISASRVSQIQTEIEKKGDA